MEKSGDDDGLDSRCVLDALNILETQTTGEQRALRIVLITMFLMYLKDCADYS